MDINPSRPDAVEAGERPLNLSDFAQRNQMTEDRVWELIEEGELAARFVNDEILILREQDAADEPRIDFPETPQIAIHDDSSDILPMRMEPELTATPIMNAPRVERMQEPTAPKRNGAMNFEAERMREPTLAPEPNAPKAQRMREPTPEPNALKAARVQEPSPEPNAPKAERMREPSPESNAPKAERMREPSPEPNAPKAERAQEPTPAPNRYETMNFEEQDGDEFPADDYRDLLVFAQDAMNRTMDLSRQLLATKDELLRMKDERIQQLQFEQQRNELEIRRLRKKVEDLETLCRLTPNP